MKQIVMLTMTFVMVFPGIAGAQANVNFSGTWTLSKIEPPPAGGIGGGGDETFGAIAQTVVIAQNARDLTFQSGSMRAAYTLDDNTTVTPPGDVNGLKTRAHWEGSKLHLHYKRGQNWDRDILSMNGNTLTILRDLESGGGSTTRTITYARAPAGQPVAQAPQTDYANMTMKVDKLADNFYTVTGLNGVGRTGGALGVLTGPDGIFMVDATFAPLSEKVVAAIRTFSNAPIRYVVNTHAHGDHSGGDTAFAKMGATIMSRPELRAALVGQRGFDPAGLPSLTYPAPITFRMNGDEVTVIPVPPSHTDGDSMVYFRTADVLMTGDVFRNGYPNIGGTVDGMIQALGMAIAICGPNTKVVPGHGAVSTRADIIAHKDMIVTVRDRIVALIKQGKSEDAVVAAHPTASFDQAVLKDIRQYYDEGNMVRYRDGDAFVKQVYQQLKPKS
jgi:cyclase